MRESCTRLRTQSGMTLVELMVVLGIIVVLGAAIYPSLGNVLQVTGSKGAAEQVASAIRLARQFAITRGTNHCIRFGATPSTHFQVRLAPDDTNCTGAVVDEDDIGHGLAVLNPANLSIIFNPIGNVRNFTPGNPTVTLDVNTNPASCQMQVLVTLYGGVRAKTGVGC